MTEILIEQPMDIPKEDVYTERTLFHDMPEVLMNEIAHEEGKGWERDGSMTVELAGIEEGKKVFMYSQNMKRHLHPFKFKEYRSLMDNATDQVAAYLDIEWNRARDIIDRGIDHEREFHLHRDSLTNKCCFKDLVEHSVKYRAIIEEWCSKRNHC